MSPGEIAILSLIIAVFIVFAVTLGWVSWDDSRTVDKDSRVDKRHPVTLPTNNNVNSSTPSVNSA
jgi:hypothetical protein